MLKPITTQVAKLKPIDRIERRSPESTILRRIIVELELDYCDHLIAVVQDIKENKTLRRMLFACHILMRHNAMGKMLDSGVNSIQAKKDQT